MSLFWIFFILTVTFLFFGGLRMTLKKEGRMLAVLGVLFCIISLWQTDNAVTDEINLLHLTVLMLSSFSSLIIGAIAGFYLKDKKKATEKETVSAT